MSGKIQAVAIYFKAQPAEDLARESLKRIHGFFGDLPIFSNIEIPGTTRVQAASLFQTARAGYATAASLRPTSVDDGIAIFDGLCPFLDSDLTRDLMEVHLKYFAHVTYCENVPPGFVPDFASADFLAEVPEPGPADMRDFVFKNIERFDAEVLYRAPDLRQFRLDFSGSDARSVDLVRQLSRLKPDVKYSELQEQLLAHPEILRPFPSYFEIYLTSLSPVKPVIAPLIEETTSLDVSLAEKLDREIQEQNWQSDGTVCLGGPGEPLLHPDFEKVLSIFLANPCVHTVFLETFGASLDPALSDRLIQLQNIEKLSVILRLSTLRRDRYRFLYGADLFESVMANVGHLEKIERPFAVYVEMLKIKEVEEEITPFYDRFEKSTIRVILNKYNSYAGQLPERRVSDLTPLHRDFCWHIARDFFLRPDGTVPLCKQNPSGKGGPVLDFRTHSIREILEKTVNLHSASVRGEHNSIPMPCTTCDEWYTFNG